MVNLIRVIGQAALLGRRMIEAGARFVTVLWDAPDGYSWGSHRTNADVEKYLLPGLDQTLSALLEDLHLRGLLDETLAVCVGEMGRTPKPDTVAWGRGHWSYCFPPYWPGPEFVVVTFTDDPTGTPPTPSIRQLARKTWLAQSIMR